MCKVFSSKYEWPGVLDKCVLSTHVIQHKAQAGDFIEFKLSMVTESIVFVQTKLFEKSYLDLNPRPHEREESTLPSWYYV